MLFLLSGLVVGSGVALVLHLAGAVAVTAVQRLKRSLTAPLRGRKKAAPSPSFTREVWTVLRGFFKAEIAAVMNVLTRGRQLVMAMAEYLQVASWSLYLMVLLLVARLGLACRTVARRVAAWSASVRQASRRSIDPQVDEVLNRLHAAGANSR